VLNESANPLLKRKTRLGTAHRSINQSIIILSDQMHCSHCTSIWGDIMCREMTVKKGKFYVFV